MDALVWIAGSLIILIASIVIFVKESRRGAGWTTPLSKMVRNVIDTLSGGI